MSYQQTTINTYNDNISHYIDGTPSVVSGDFKQWIDLTLSCVLQSSRILELWTWLGRDSDYMESLWYTPIRSDVSESFILHNKQKWKEVRELNVLDFHDIKQYDLIFANAVLLHLNKEDFTIAIENIYNALSSWWYLSFSVKAGEWEWYSEEKMNAPRYFNYWSVENLIPILEDMWFDIFHNSIVSNWKRIQVIAQKI